MKKLLSLGLIFSLQAFAQNGAGLLLKDSKENIDLTSRLVKQKTLNLDNPFKVQLFGSWKAARIFDEPTNQWVELVLNDKNQQALLNYPLIYKQNKSDFQKIMQGTLAYIEWKLGLDHAFVDHWIELSSTSNFLQTELGVALDQVVGKNATSWILNKGIVLTASQKESLKKIENKEGGLNFALQAWKNQRKGEQSLQWVNKLEENDPLRIKLIYTAITDYANRGKLALSGQLIKKAIEPYIEKSNDHEEVAYYYLTLARLLYQARAFDAANFYYELIPQASSYFLQAQVESSWADIQLNAIAAAKGKLATLDLNLFSDKFIPDVYLTRAIVNLKTCQFQEIQKDLNHFVMTNKKWAKKISKNLESDHPKRVDLNLYTQAIVKHRASLQKEKEKMSGIFTDSLVQKNQDLASFYQKQKDVYSLSEQNLNTYEIAEYKQQWNNRLKMLEDAIYRMKFVRIEFLSQMRNFALNIPLSNTDSVSTYHAAPRRNNEMVFPNDGNLWGDDLFNMSAEVENLCLKGLKK